MRAKAARVLTAVRAVLAATGSLLPQQVWLAVMAAPVVLVAPHPVWAPAERAVAAALVVRDTPVSQAIDLLTVETAAAERPAVVVARAVPVVLPPRAPETVALAVRVASAVWAAVVVPVPPAITALPSRLTARTAAMAAVAVRAVLAVPGVRRVLRSVRARPVPRVLMVTVVMVARPAREVLAARVLMALLA